MTSLIYILIAFLTGLLIFIIYQLKELKRMQEAKENPLSQVAELIKTTQQELSATRQEMRGGLDRSNEMIQKQLSTTNERLTQAARVIGELQEIARQMSDLQAFLKSPKLRGNIGEQVLRDLLEQYFPYTQFKLQYKFKTGRVVDAILKTDKGIIPIDSKFPMENFQKYIQSRDEKEKKEYFRGFIRDVKKHIDDISEQYILPQEGTVDFAVMYIPAEAVYYEVIKNIDLNRYAIEKRVLVVSPNSFYYFLKVLMIGLEGKRIEEATKRILEMLAAIQKDASKFSEQLRILTSHLNNARLALDRVNAEYAKLSSKIDQTKLLK
ncbi:MAG: DNA recombination protein RmuC [Patescibacteria group bacterium]|nr:DNA recombination protein RmuC [Patescibacteria group bacterium]